MYTSSDVFYCWRDLVEQYHQDESLINFVNSLAILVINSEWPRKRLFEEVTKQNLGTLGYQIACVNCGWISPYHYTYCGNCTHILDVDAG